MTALEELIQNAGMLRVKLETPLAGVTVDGKRNIIAAALHRLCISHYFSFLILLGMGRRASALALIRPCTDAAQRSLYVNLSDSTELLDLIAKDDKKAFGFQQEMVNEIHSRLGDTIFGDVHGAFGILSSYTHGGAKQIDRQVTPEGLLAENISDDECIAALITATFPVVFCTYFLSVRWRGESEAAKSLLPFYVRSMPVPLEAQHLVRGSSLQIPGL